MKPRHILFYVLGVLGSLLLLSLVFPREGISLGENTQVRFVSARDLFAKDTVSTAYTDSLIQHTLATADPEAYFDSLLLFFKPKEEINMDSVIQARIDSISKRVYPIDFSEQGKEALHRFFSRADGAQDAGELIRILHLGYSQIENDRMTSLLRYRFQKVFGGSGVGMVPAVPLYFGNPAFVEQSSGDWIRYTGFGKRDTTLGHKSYGSLACFTSIPATATLKEQGDDPSRADADDLPSLEFEFRKGRRASRFSKVKLFMHSYRDSGSVSMLLNDTIQANLDIAGSGYQELALVPDTVVQKIRMEFDFSEGGRIYGISFDSFSGVQVDNVAMRGSSGVEFRRSDREILEQMAPYLNTGLILMQFGGNTVPYLQSTSYYKRSFMREIAFLKEVYDNPAIIVIGPSDMATKENGKFTTYPMLEPVRDALKEAALESGVSFWDMYGAMGGLNSMQNFVLADPPLAQVDYVHFTPTGANMMAGMFYEAVMLEYNRYKSKE